MMLLRLCFVLSLFTPLLAFAPLSIKKTVLLLPKRQQNQHQQQTTTTTQRNAGMVMIDSESDAKYYINKAQECAFSSDNDDVCSLEEQKDYLNEIITIQSGCVIGTLASQEVCNDKQQLVAEIVAQLRHKVATQESIKAAANANSLQLVKMTFLGGLVPSLLFLMGVLWTTMDHGLSSADGVVEPYTLEEWSWAIQGGYLPTMVSHYLRNFGL